MTPHHRGTRDPRWALLSERADSAFAPDRAQGLHLMPTLAFRPLQACAERYARRLQPSRAGSRVESRGSVFPHRPTAPLREQVRRVPEQTAGDQREDDPHTDVSRDRRAVATPTVQSVLRLPARAAREPTGERGLGVGHSSAAIIHPCNCSATRGRLAPGGDLRRSARSASREARRRVRSAAMPVRWSP